ncbi:ABC transporter ATP-binding protein [Patiriisocius hiemis]|uniref:ABC transporter ATP-binding protein n=1 Tax=Patiriisocius hiemis TaxID=3075604 RepID=A0ABU2Y9N2_9FLAO|nr:ABC transporter ATP-binding protein [Constantimarinum sp. W242]MDT0554546.1 ABC transporter ATP-binding protein [Constantimarinum sp. W242]
MKTFQLYNAQIKFGSKELLQNVSFTLSTGEVLGIFGRNGSGKSTLLKMLFGTQQGGSIGAAIDSKIFNPKENILQQHIGYVPQHEFVPKQPKVRDIIPMYYPDEETQDKVFYTKGIHKLTAKRVGELSEGERKFFEVILVGSGSHPFLFLDEPFSMIDPLKKDLIKEFLLQRKETKGIIITDHYYDDVLQMTSKNIVLKDGKSFTISSVENLKEFEYLSKN